MRSNSHPHMCAHVLHWIDLKYDENQMGKFQAFIQMTTDTQIELDGDWMKDANKNKRKMQ